MLGGYFQTQKHHLSTLFMNSFTAFGWNSKSSLQVYTSPQGSISMFSNHLRNLHQCQQLQKVENKCFPPNSSLWETYNLPASMSLSAICSITIKPDCGSINHILLAIVSTSSDIKPLFALWHVTSVDSECLYFNFILLLMSLRLEYLKHHLC